jgi:hypothetical protein
MKKNEILASIQLTFAIFAVLVEITIFFFIVVSVMK